MLRECGRVVRAGGKLIYATCSSEPEENEQVVAAFLEDGGFNVVAPRNLPPAVLPLVNDAGHLRTYPFRDGLEAFFAVVLERG